MKTSQVSNYKVMVKNEAEDKALKKSCRDFEGVLINYMMKSMRNTLEGDAVFGKSLGKDIFQSMFDEYLSREISSGDNNFGIGDSLYKQLKGNEQITVDEEKQIQKSSLDLELMNRQFVPK